MLELEGTSSGRCWFDELSTVWPAGIGLAGMALRSTIHSTGSAAAPQAALHKEIARQRAALAEAQHKIK